MKIGKGTRIHFMGIGGIGMSGLATVCRERGAIVSGCDAKPNELIRRLQAHGASIRLGHHPDHLEEGADLVVYSAAVSEAEPELRTARRRGHPVISRGAFLAELAAERLLVAVAGAHGKTTTSGMASQLLMQAGWDPTVIVGGLMRSLGTNARSGTGSYLVAETDESDGSFLHLRPSMAIVTNIDREHLNYYQTLERLVEAFQQFAGQLRPGGRLIRCTDDPLIRRLLSHPRQLSYGLDAAADVTAERIAFTPYHGSPRDIKDIKGEEVGHPPKGSSPRPGASAPFQLVGTGSACGTGFTGYGSRFRAVYNGRPLGMFTLQVPGRHNVLNALAVISLGLTLDIPLLTIREALAAFQGTGRRFQLVQLPGDIRLVEDYAHHPAEIQATLDADATVARHRLVVFQPHRFSRTQSLEDEFAMCFDRADGVIVTDIYPAFEAPIPGVSGERLARLIRGHGHRWVRYIPKQELAAFVSRIALPGDTIFFLGAGDITEVCHELAERLHAPAGATG